MEQTVENVVYHNRYVYNSAFHEGQLFEAIYVKKLMLMYKLSNPHILHSENVALLPVIKYVKRHLSPMSETHMVTVHTKV